MRYFVISSSKFNKNIFRLILGLFKILYGTFNRFVDKKYRPDLVVGFEVTQVFNHISNKNFQC